MSGVAPSLDEQIQCVSRELRFRERVYARRVQNGQMTQSQSDREIGRMKAVLETLRDVRTSAASSFE